MSAQTAEPIYRNAKEARAAGRRYDRMAREVAGYPEHEGQQEKVSELRGRSRHAHRFAAALEQGETPPARRGPKTEPAREGFSAKRAMRRAGISATRRADRAARNAPRVAGRTVQSSGALPNLGFSQVGVGGMIVYVFASIVLLAILDNALGGRGPAGVAKTFAWLSGAVTKLVSPTDPLIPRGTPAGAVATPAAAAAAATKPAGAGAGATTRPGTTNVITIH